MREAVAGLFGALARNTTNVIVSYEDGRRCSRTFAEFAADVEAYAERLQHVKEQHGVERVALIGPTSYRWAVCDYACIRAGIVTIALPETISADEAAKLARANRADAVLCDAALEPSLGSPAPLVWTFGSGGARPFDDVPAAPLAKPAADRIPEEYSVAFTSGTTGTVKPVVQRFRKLESPPRARGLAGKLRLLRAYVRYKRSFWSRKDNRLFLYMPFSHAQQRSFFMTALFNGIDVVLSDQQSALRHLVVERPNIMVSVPLLYELMAPYVRRRLRELSPVRRLGYRLFNALRINRLASRNPLKRAFQALVLPSVGKIYGGRADYFVTGSAKIDPGVLRLFDSIGVRIFEAYGQSEIGTIAISDHANHRIGSVGKPKMDVAIAADGEILVKYDPALHDESLERNAAGYLHTGDLGRLDADGFLYVDGRKDDVIVLRNGEKVLPSEVEALLARELETSAVAVFSRDGTALDAAIAPPPHLAASELAARLARLNAGLGAARKIRAYHVASEPFTIANGLLTNTFKLRRRAIAERFAASRFSPVPR